MSTPRWYFLASILVALLVSLYYYFYALAPLPGASGRTLHGLLLGWLGFAAMLGALAYSARRRRLGSAMRWIRVDADTRRTRKENERKTFEKLSQLQKGTLRQADRPRKQLQAVAKRIIRQVGLGRYISARAYGSKRDGMRLEVRRREWLGRLEIWYYWHLMLGCLSVLLILTHAGFRFDNLIATLAFVCLVGVVVTGIWGYFVYRIVPPKLTQVEAKAERTSEELLAELTEVTQEIQALAKDKSERFQTIYTREMARPGITFPLSWRWLHGPAEIQRDPQRPGRFRLIADEILGDELEDFRHMVRLIFRKEKLEVLLYPLYRYEYHLKVWLSAHIPLTAGMMVFSLVHIVSVFYY